MNIAAALRRSAVPVAGIVVVYVLAVLTEFGRRVEFASMAGHFQAGSQLLGFDTLLLGSITTVTCLLGLGLVLLIAMLRGQRRRGFLAVTAVAGAAVSAEVLKLVLPSYNNWRGGWEIGGSFPSGHTAVAATLALAVLSVCSPRWRQFLIGPAAAAVALTATATVTMMWHRPADVFGGLLLAYGWHRVTTAGEPQRRTAGALSGQGAVWAAGTSAAIIVLAVRGAVVSPDAGLPPWFPGFLDGGSGLVYVISMVLICAATAAVLLGAAYPVPATLAPAQPDPALRQPVPVGSTLPG